MLDWIIDSKLSPPSPNRGHVIRKSVLARLDSCIGGGACVLHAPAGYGKTAVLNDWRSSLTARRIPVLWLSLDEHDRSLNTFLAYVLSAYRKAISGEEPRSPSIFDLSSLSDDEATLSVLSTLSQLHTPHIIVFDDFHRAASKEVQQLVRRLAHAQIRNLTLVFSTREFPDYLGFADLRVAGDLLELSHRELGFDVEEVIALYSHADDEKNERISWLKQLHERTEGWPVAIGSALRWRSQGASAKDVLKRLSGRDSELSDYFLEQVFLDLPSDLQNFLMVTAILDRVNGDVSKVLCPKLDGWETIRILERKGVFLERADNEGNWYRYHRLYREFLVERLRRSSSLSSDTLHRMAATWFQENGLLNEAVFHTMAVNDVRKCAQLLESLGGWQYALQGDIALVQAVLKQLSIDDLADYPRLWLARVYMSVRVGHHRAGEEDLKRFLGFQEQKADTDNSIEPETALIETLVQRYTDRPVTRDGIDRIERLADQLPLDNEVLQAVRANYLCAMYREVSEYSLSDRYAGIALDHYRAIGANYAEAFIYYHQGLTYMRQARFSAARSCYDQGLSIAQRLFGADNDLAAIGRIFLAECYYETSEVEAAMELLERSLIHAERADAWLEVYAAGYTTLLRIAYEGGDTSMLERIFARAMETASRRQLPRLASLVALQDEDLALRQQTVPQRFLNADPKLEWDQVSQALRVSITARAHIDAQNWESARHALEQPRQEAQRTGFFRGYIQLSLLLSATEWNCGNTEHAIEIFESAVSIAILEDARQVLFEERQLLLPILQYILGPDSSAAMAPARASFLRKLRADMQVTAQLIEQEQCVLSIREIEILRCLMMGESNREIAAGKALSINTVKFHLKNIFSKLGASSRDEAVAFAIRDQLL
ncbi:helix-turn-helix transcriptional regulator [Congregibacter litoralis]|uniref:ATP-dependent transcriptional regulator n=1 Tax=Congregibacter litoralis KT71 TaxID=314285 RepID=A4A4M2_9GAMM|nr:LuxR C-terminal-related transcriptional regulator [Congregibacter litoralis]EAQ98743.1 ATP-dependent transcriptional regulator [Congregibacter litoralis KT71]